MSAYGLLCNEPWCYTPREVGRLTDWQIMELIVKPAARRGRKNRGGPVPRGREREEDRGPLAGLPGREAFIRGGVEIFGGDPDELAAEYDAAVAGLSGDNGSGPE